MDVSVIPSVAGLLMLIGMGGGLGLPFGMPPEPEDLILAQVAPDECLFYTSWAAAAAPDPQSSNQTEQLLAEPEVQNLIGQLRRLARQGLRKAALEEGEPEVAEIADDLVAWSEKLVTSPGAVFISKLGIGPAGPDIRAGALVHVGDGAGQLEATLEKLQQRFIPEAVSTVEIGEDTWYRIQPPNPKAPAITWGVKSGYFAIGIGQGVIEGMLERVRTAPPEWLAQIARQLPVARRSTVTYINVEAIREILVPLIGGPKAGGALEALGLGNVASLVSVTGLDETGFIGRTLVGLGGPPQGLLRLAAGKPLEPDDLAPIPRDATIALAARLDLEHVLDTILSAAGQVDRGAREDILEGLGEMEEELGINLRRDLLGPLGDAWCVYNSPSEGGLVVTGLTAVVNVDDHQQLAETHARLLATARAAMGQRRRGPRIDQFQFAGHDVFVFNARDDDFPLAPSWCLTESALVIAAFPQNIKAYLSRGDAYQSVTTVPAIAEMLESESGVCALAYVDARRVFELVYPVVLMVAQAALGELSEEGIDVSVAILPSAQAIAGHLRPSVCVVRRTDAGIEIVHRQTMPSGSLGSSVPIAVATLLPAVSSAREAAGRTQSMNHMKQIALALHNYHDTFKSFPPAYTADEEGKPLLSWRVHILPFLEHQGLYKQFHLDEPWDSEHNKRLIPMMPPVLRSPGSKAGSGKTNYLGVGGPQGIFPGQEKVAIRKIRDGTSNTIMVLEVNDRSAVVWTRPDDFQPDPDHPKKGLLGLRPGGFLAGFADGSVQFLGPSLDDRMLQGMLTRDGGEVIQRW